MWTAGTVCDTLLLFQIEFVEYSPFAFVSFMDVWESIIDWHLYNFFLYKTKLRLTVRQMSPHYWNFPVLHFGHLFRSWCTAILERDWEVDSMRLIFIIFAIGIHFQLRFSVFCQSSLWTVQSQSFLRGLGMFHAHEKLSEGWAIHMTRNWMHSIFGFSNCSRWSMVDFLTSWYFVNLSKIPLNSKCFLMTKVQFLEKYSIRD